MLIIQNLLLFVDVCLFSLIDINRSGEISEEARRLHRRPYQAGYWFRKILDSPDSKACTFSCICLRHVSHLSISLNLLEQVNVNQHASQMHSVIVGDPILG